MLFRSGTYVRHGPRKRQGLLRIGVLMNYITDYISPVIISGMEETLNANNASMVLTTESLVADIPEKNPPMPASPDMGGMY